MDQTNSISVVAPNSISVVAPINWVIITFGKNYLLFLSLIAVFDLSFTLILQVLHLS